jgi:hypothetical protein
VFPQDVRQPTVICIEAMADLNPHLGIACQNGTFVPLS